MNNQILIDGAPQVEAEKYISETSMDIEILYGENKAKLLYSQSIVLLNSVCTLNLSSPKVQNELLGWTVSIEFTNDPYNGVFTPKTQFGFSEEAKKINIMCHNWNGDTMENNNAIDIFSKRYLVTFLIKIRTTSYLSTPEKRNVDISIWQKM